MSVHHEQLKQLYHGFDKESLKTSFLDHLEFSLGRDTYTSTPLTAFQSLVLTIRDRLIEKWLKTQQTYYDLDVKRVYYLSMEFLMGRSLGNSLINMGLLADFEEAMRELGYDLDELRQVEMDAGLGNGGLGRLAACFLDSMATLEIPCYGYGIRYEYGIFRQKIVDGCQVESPDNWLRYGNPWEIPRPEYLYPVNFYGKVLQYKSSSGKLVSEWIDTEQVMAMAYDIPIPGYHNNTVNTLRLWSALATREFDMKYFNDGDYMRALREKNESEIISKVLYPNDNNYSGKELRLKQEYFFVSASLQDIIRRYKKNHNTFDEFPEKNAIQLNDTHPALAIAEMMRLLVDVEGVDWDKAWDITQKTFAYTNHTVMPEALEKWPVSMLESILPRHLQIIYEINYRFLESVRLRYPDDVAKWKRMSLIEEGPQKSVRMAYLAIVGSHSVNGVAALHTEILKRDLFHDFYDFYPERFNNKTNGVTQRRWLHKCNPRLSALISEVIGEGWITNLYELKRLEPYAEDSAFRAQWRAVKLANKESLAKLIERETGVKVSIDSMFDTQVKRIHEYKRQLLNVLQVIARYNRIKDNPNADFVPRTVIFGGKAAPGYKMAKLIIKLINSVAYLVNNDPGVRNLLKVVFLADYRVSLAERIIPATELSEQISTAGTEASGTGNMKLGLNGALTIGTMDGANIEIYEEVGPENIFIFGLTADEVQQLSSTYDPRFYYSSNAELRRVLDMIRDGFFSPHQRDLFHPIYHSLVDGGDRYMLLADFQSYLDCQQRVDETYVQPDKWDRMSILNTARLGKFSSDRTIMQYAQEIWKVQPVKIEISSSRGKKNGC
ncbi:MAG: glycogen/starch/alpha-glucan phosphorylase [Acidobacteriota bacterium]|nr:glycogen/starch/alpha-glucan phosphorylase [Blastocatellia bacterium]MDW8411347.1 glycogen/starch/alpha-glucan phosphorylase [Acidobacteriota bacterium]